MDPLPTMSRKEFMRQRETETLMCMVRANSISSQERIECYSHRIDARTSSSKRDEAIRITMPAYAK